MNKITIKCEKRFFKAALDAAAFQTTNEFEASSVPLFDKVTGNRIASFICVRNRRGDITCNQENVNYKKTNTVRSFIDKIIG